MKFVRLSGKMNAQICPTKKYKKQFQEYQEDSIELEIDWNDVKQGDNAVFLEREDKVYGLRVRIFVKI